MARFQANPGDAVPIVLICALAFGASRIGAEVMGIANGAFAGALTVGVASGLHSRWKGKPALVTSTVGIIMLVPGSVGFRSITKIIANDPVAGIQTALSLEVEWATARRQHLAPARDRPRRSWRCATRTRRLGFRSPRLRLGQHLVVGFESALRGRVRVLLLRQGRDERSHRRCVGLRLFTRRISVVHGTARRDAIVFFPSLVDLVHVHAQRFLAYSLRCPANTSPLAQIRSHPHHHSAPARP
jgi:hypothetical protein